MRDHRKRALLLFSLAALSVPLVAAALAHACTAVATLSLDKGAAAPGTVVTVTGKGFGTHDPSDATGAQPAEIRLGSLTAPVLAKASPSGAERGFSVQVTIPEGASGETFLAATQKTANGTTVYGTPARQSITVTPAAAKPAPAPAAPAPAATPGPAPTGSSPAAVIENMVDNELALRNAISRCKRKYSAKRAKTAGAKRRMAKQRSACVKRARGKYSA